MPYRRIPGHDRTTPLKYWLRKNLPSERPEWVKAHTWGMLHAYIVETSLREMEDQYGVSTEAISIRFRAVARRLGYIPPKVQRWLLPDGHVAPHMIDVDPQTGCWLWRGTFSDDQLGPFGLLPKDLRPPDSTAAYPRQPVRRFLYEQQHAPLPRNQVVVAACGYQACVNPEHGSVRKWIEGRSATYREEPLHRKHEETAREAAARLGVSVQTIRSVRGIGGKTTDTSKLRPWLKEHLPAHQPASVIEQDWDFARRYVEGVTLAALGAEAGVSRQMVQFRIKRLATTLGWDAHG